MGHLLPDLPDSSWTALAAYLITIMNNTRRIQQPRCRQVNYLMKRDYQVRRCLRRVNNILELVVEDLRRRLEEFNDVNLTKMTTRVRKDSKQEREGIA